LEGSVRDVIEVISRDLPEDAKKTTKLQKTSVSMGGAPCLNYIEEQFLTLCFAPE
jgi:hypothetical protein